MDLRHIKVICYRRYLMLYINKEQYGKISANCCVKILKWYEMCFSWECNFFFYILRKKFYRASKRTKINRVNVLLICLTNHNFFFVISIFFTKQFADIVKNCSYCKAINYDGKKWLLLDVNLNTRFLDVQKIPNGPN